MFIDRIGTKMCVDEEWPVCKRCNNIILNIVNIIIAAVAAP